MTREEAFMLVTKHMKNKNLIKHVLAVEAIMRALARHFGENEAEWALCGLLHDLDYDQTKDTPEEHSLLTEKILQDTGVDASIIHAIKCHNDKAEKTDLMDWAVYAADPVSGFIVAAALMHPDKKLAPLDLDFLKRRFKEKRFAAGASRKQMQSCEKLGLTVDEFLLIALAAMQAEHQALGLMKKRLS